MFIEFKGKDGKPSGISVTKAHWYVYYFYQRTIWYIETKALKLLIEFNNYKIYQDAGDGNSTGYLIPKENVRKYFIIK